MNNNKKKGIIYKIEFGDYLYVGSTKSYYLSDRQSVHNDDLRKNKGKNRLINIKAKENGIDFLKCIFICNFYFDTIEELRQEEEKYRIMLNANLNMVKCHKENKNDKSEYYINYNNKMKNDLQYREKRLKQKKNEYENNKETYKINYEINKDKKKEYNKNYYIKNASVICDNCGSSIIKCNLKRHKTSKKCLNYNKNE